ncbi:MAG: class I SAM-dependent methyltransferase, partial [Ginsengibacter sp.]
TEAAEFIDKLIDYLQPNPGSMMLDVGCGKGRYSIQLASKGFDVTGIDISQHSITKALNNETDHLHFFLHDMRLPFWINYFDYAFNFFTSFGYFNTRREHNNSIRTISQSLHPGGTFVIDYLNIHHEENNLIPQCDISVGDVHYSITKWFDETHFYKKITVTDKNVNEPLHFSEKVSKFSLDDFLEMLSSQKMQVKEVFGDYNFNKYDLQNSPRLIIVAKKMIE